MNFKHSMRSFVLAQALTLATTFGSEAASEDYAFRIIGSELHQGAGASITVSLIDLRTNAPVSDAVIFTTRLDMAPEGMEAMTTPVEAMASVIPGQYQFKADLAMAGNWRFQIAAKVQGEAETVQGELILGVKP
ncbi:MAG: FixH family protein [Candidatus Saccharibacteria bacterium]|nr:FixH family protein [Pseudorhodobacter sp.]